MQTVLATAEVASGCVETLRRKSRWRSGTGAFQEGVSLSLSLFAPPPPSPLSSPVQGGLSPRASGPCQGLAHSESIIIVVSDGCVSDGTAVAKRRYSCHY